MTELEHAIKHIKTRADAWAVKEVTEALQSISERLDKALSQKPCDDAISRKDAEQMFRNIRSHLKPQDYKSAEEFNTRDLMLLNAEQMIHALPSVTQKSGKWIYDETLENWRCSKCNETPKTMGYVGTADFMAEHFKFCNHCGAKMESEE